MFYRVSNAYTGEVLCTSCARDAYRAACSMARYLMRVPDLFGRGCVINDLSARKLYHIKRKLVAVQIVDNESQMIVGFLPLN